jgi:acyl-CoA dehydrogenase
LGHEVAKNFIKNSDVRNEVTSGVFIPQNKSDTLGRLENALALHEKSLAALDKIKVGIKAGILPRKRPGDLVEEAFEHEIINLEDKHLILDAATAMLDVVQVDEYSLEEIKKI